MARRSTFGLGLVTAGSAAWLVVLAAIATGQAHWPVAGAVPFAVLFVTGVVAWWQRPRQGAAWRLLAAGAGVSVAFNLSVLIDTAVGLRDRPAGWAIAVVATASSNLALAALVDLFCSFPDGRYPARWTRWAAWSGYAVAAGSTVLTVLHPRTHVPLSTVQPPVTTRMPFGGPVVELIGSWPVLDSWLFAFLPVAVLAMVVRYRHADVEARAQLRWPIAGVGVLALVVLLSWSGLFDWLAIPDPVAQVMWAAALSAVPLALLVGIVRHGLFDLHLAVRRSVSYGVLWLLIAALYAGISAAPGVAATGRVPPAVAIGVTIAAAMAFQPARRWLERCADRLVFGDRIGGYALIRRFGSLLETAVPEADLAARVADTARQGLDARWAAVWVLGPDGNRADLAGLAGTITTPPAVVADLSVAGEPVGRLACGPRRRGHHTAEDEQLLRTLGRQAALGLSHARLSEQLRDRLDQLDAQASELAASRARLVAAEAAGRRRLERDIHDGVQQQLVSLMTKLTVARAQLSAGSDTVGVTLDTMQQEFRQAVADLRDLASGIHPAVLTDQGLVAAVVALAARLPLPVTIESPNGAGARMDQQVEAAAYFGIAEALTNVLKHADARQAWVRLAHADGRLTVEIGDDGCGFDTATTGQRGLSGIRDRVEALDGTLAVASRPAGPTTIRMTLPTPVAGHG